LPIRRLTHTVAKLPPERREANLYYGIGEIICEVAKKFRNEGVRRKAVSSCALKMVELALKSRKTIPLDQPFRPFTALAIEAQQELPPWHRALTGALTQARIREQSAIAFLERWNQTSMMRQMVRSSYPVAGSIAMNTLAGAMGVFSTLLSRHNPTSKATDEVRQIAIEPEEVEKVRTSPAFAQAAQLRLDEFENGKGWTGLGETLGFDRNYLRATPPPRTINKKGLLVPHEERHSCPALQADGFAIEVARAIVPDIIMVARRIVPGEYFNVNYPELITSCRLES
jgi:hypothetical protein